MTVLEDFDVADGVYDATLDFGGMIRQPAGSLVASAIPVRPPSSWFANPTFDRLQPLTITADGHAFGHIASWREDHIGMNGRVKAPRSKSGYAFFATGVLETAEGKLVNVGQITLTGGHASLEASVADAVAHYDNTDSAIMDVAVGEDRHGIWVAGALRPTVDDNQLRAIRASSVSGDWRPINGSLEMVAVCAVNVPGFPIPRARVASGHPVALVAAGTGALVDLAMRQDSGDVDSEIAASYEDRLRFVEDLLLGRIGDQRQVLTAAVEAARALQQTPPDPAITAALRDRVHGDDGAVVASLRDRVHGEGLVAGLRDRVHANDEAELWDDGMPIDLDLADCLQASLRARVKGGLLARATKEWTEGERRKAANRGAAMPGGRFPIKDKRDVAKAVRAVGRAKGDKSKVRAHIQKRARALGATSAIPDSWK